MVHTNPLGNLDRVTIIQSMTKTCTYLRRYPYAHSCVMTSQHGKLSTLQTICTRNLLLVCEPPSQKASNIEIWCCDWMWNILWQLLHLNFEKNNIWIWWKTLLVVWTPGLNLLTCWSQAKHICINNLIIVASCIGLQMVRHQAIIWTTAALLLIGWLGTYFSKIQIKTKIIF